MNRKRRFGGDRPAGGKKRAPKPRLRKRSHPVKEKRSQTDENRPYPKCRRSCFPKKGRSQHHGEKRAQVIKRVGGIIIAAHPERQKPNAKAFEQSRQRHKPPPRRGETPPAFPQGRRQKKQAGEQAKTKCKNPRRKKFQNFFRLSRPQGIEKPRRHGENQGSQTVSSTLTGSS